MRSNIQHDPMTTLIIYSLLIILSASSCTSKPPTDSKKQEKPPMQDHKRLLDYPSLSNLVSKFNANTEWDKQITPDSFTVDIEAALISNQRPILFIGELVDLERRDDKYLLHFNSPEESLNSHNVRFLLKCNQEQFDRVHSDNRSFETYAVIASISSVRRVESEITTDDDRPHIEIEDRLLAEGQCVDVLPTRSLQQ